MMKDNYGTHAVFCPACSRNISFISAATNFRVCDSCGAVIRRTKNGQTETVKQPLVSYTADRIQPGTTGFFEGSRFTVTGRFQVWTDDVVFNYWTVCSDDQITEWLAEGYGMFAWMSLSPVQHDFIPDQLDRLQTGSLISFPGTREELLVEKKQKLLFADGEGEWYMPDWGTEPYFIELAGMNGERYCVIYGGGEKIFLFSVKVVQRTDLSLNRLRETAETGVAKACPKCGHENILLAFPYSKSCACAACGTMYSIKGKDKIENHGIAGKGYFNYNLRVGSTGSVDGIAYQVVGYTEKQDHSAYQSKWREYTLYNRDTGFAFLSEYDGHWILLKEQWHAPVVKNVNNKILLFDNLQFDIYNQYTCSVSEATGEFPADIFDNGSTACYEYVNPPWIWIMERDHHEGIRWFKGEHITGRTLARSFPGINIPYKVGVGAVQPTGISSRNLIKATAIGLLLLALVYFISSAGKENRVLYSVDTPFPADTNKVSFVTEKFEFGKNSSNVKFDITAGVSNSWFELAVTMVNAKSGKEYSLEKGVEYYSGYEGGERWTEGGTHETAYFTRVPAGTYFFQLEGTREAAMTTGAALSYSFASVAPSFGITITYDVSNERNFWLSVLLFLIYPVVTYIRNYYRESGRWSNSPFVVSNNTDNDD